MAKREDDARFLKSERLLVRAAIDELRHSHTTTVTRLCRRSGIFASTFYRHYKNFDELIAAHEQKVLLGFHQSASKVVWVSEERLFRECLIFIYKHRDDFELAITLDQLRVPLKMLETLQSIITRGWRMAPARVARLYQIYSYEIIGVWLIWAKKEHFSKEKIMAHAAELALLTKTAVRRLSSLG